MMSTARCIARAIVEQYAWHRWVLDYRIEEARQAARTAIKKTIVRAVMAAYDIGVWLIHALGLEDA